MICGRRFSFITVASIGFLKWFTTDFLHFNGCILPSIIRHILLYAVWYGVWFGPDFVIAHWITMNMPYHMPYPVWKCLPYRNTHPLYHVTTYWLRVLCAWARHFTFICLVDLSAPVRFWPDIMLLQQDGTGTLIRQLLIFRFIFWLIFFLTI